MNDDGIAPRWDEETDVIVLGSGFAGLAAAIEAGQAGCAVIVLEKMKGYGGNSTISAGGVAAAGTALQAKAGIDDSPQRMYEDMVAAGLGLNQPGLVRILAEKSNDTFEWTQDYLGVQYQDRVDQSGGHSVPRSYTTLHRSGADIIKQQLIKARENGVTIRTKSYLQEILKEDNGRVCGVRVRQGYTYPDDTSGKTACIRTRTAVILATGGFGNDIEFRSAQDPRLNREMGSTNKYSTTGDALREAMRIGAMPVHLSWIQLGPWACPDEKGYGIGPDFSSYIAFPYGMMVDPVSGRRFVNEMADRKIRADAILGIGHPCICMVDQQGIEVSGHQIDHCLRRGVVKKSNHIHELVNEYGIPVEDFEETVSRFNRSVGNKSDLEFGKPILPGTRPFKQPPYYSMRLWPKVHYTMGGILINEKAQVLDLNQQPIEGFYAAGEVTGGVHGASRLGSCAIIDCLVFGRIAGQQAGNLSPSG
jgi:flavocytochrome c